MMKIRTKHILALLALALVFGCADSAELRHPLKDVARSGTALVEVIDKVCTTQPERLDALKERFLYFLEYSDKTNQKDPPKAPCATCLDQTERVNLVAGITGRLSAQSLERKSTVYTFTDAVIEKTDGFVEDPKGVAETLVGSSGGARSDIYSVLLEATDQIKTDVLQNRSAEVTRYNIFVVVSGLPNVDDDSHTLHSRENPTNILTQVDRLIQLKNSFSIFDISLNIILVAELEDDIDDAINLYSEIVSKTGGVFDVVYPNEAGTDASINLNHFSFFNTLIPTMIPEQVILFNRNVRLDGSGARSELVLDSDGDGISDVEEDELGTNPRAWDSDGDSIGDRLEQLMNTDPLVEDHICLTEDLGDLDQDGLSDCEEYKLGLNPLRFDSDGDDIPDLAEVLFRTNPLLKDALDDDDRDGLSNLQEIKQGLDPVNPTDEGDVSLFGYVYEVEIEDRPIEKIKCLEIKVKNVILLPTLDASRNLIELDLIETPDNPVPLKLNRQATYLTEGYVDDEGIPERIMIFIDPEDFITTSQKGLL
jgi:hypothetical protein